MGYKWIERILEIFLIILMNEVVVRFGLALLQIIYNKTKDTAILTSVMNETRSENFKKFLHSFIVILKTVVTENFQFNVIINQMQQKNHFAKKDNSPKIFFIIL